VRRLSIVATLIAQYVALHRCVNGLGLCVYIGFCMSTLHPLPHLVAFEIHRLAFSSQVRSCRCLSYEYI